MPQEGLQIEDVRDAEPSRRILRLTGPILLPSVFQFQSMVRTNNSRALILDMSNVPYIDSAGIGALVGAHIAHQKDGRSLSLVGVNDRVRNSMKVTQVDKFFQYYATVAEAEQASA